MRRRIMLCMTLQFFLVFSLAENAMDEAFTEAYTEDLALEDEDLAGADLCDACVKVKWASWCSHTRRCFNGVGFLSHAKECPINATDPRPNWGQGCRDQKAHGVWGNNHSQFFHSEWAKERDEIVRKTLAYDVRTRYGHTFAISKKLGCPDNQAPNYNPYRKIAPDCTGIQSLLKAQQAIHRAVGLKKASQIRKKYLENVRAKAKALHAKQVKAAIANLHRAVSREHHQAVIPHGRARNSSKSNAIERAAHLARQNVTQAIKHLDALAAKKEKSRAAQQHAKDLEVASSRCANCPATKKTPAKDCSVSCACSRGGLLTPYGKYSGIQYTGCPGEVPCDPVDSVAQMHDWCVSQRGRFSCECAHQIYSASKAAGRYLKKHPHHVLCPLGREAAAELAFEAGMQWGVCKLASRACKFFWLDTIGVQCGKSSDILATATMLQQRGAHADSARAAFPSVLQRFKALDSDGSGEISLQEAHQLRHEHSADVALAPLDVFSRWHSGLDKDSSGGLDEREYALSWGA